MKNPVVIFLIFAAALVSCNKESITDNNQGPSRITFRLTDAPAVYDKVFIDVVGAQVIINDTIIDLEVNAGIYNLLDFVNGKDTILVDQMIPAGELSQIRLILGENNSLLIGPDSHDLFTPSAQQSGLKLNVHTRITPGLSYEYIIDFDAARSIVATGSGKFILKPVLKVFSKVVSGAIEGVVSPVDARPLIYAVSSQLDSVSAYADTITGRFMFRGLSEGNYDLSFLPQSPYSDTTLMDIEVNTGMVTKLDTLKIN